MVWQKNLGQLSLIFLPEIFLLGLHFARPEGKRWLTATKQLA
jgi:hypothetical protein